MAAKRLRQRAVEMLSATIGEATQEEIEWLAERAVNVDSVNFDDDGNDGLPQRVEVRLSMRTDDAKRSDQLHIINADLRRGGTLSVSGRGYMSVRFPGQTEHETENVLQPMNPPESFEDEEADALADNGPSEDVGGSAPS